MNVTHRINSTVRHIPPLAIYIAGALPAFWFLYLGLTGGLGVEPIRALEHELGLFGLKLFIVVLAVTPLRTYAGISLFRIRRALGLLVFYYITLHLLVWLFLDVQIWSQILGDILKRPYITIGMAAFVLLIPLAVTSNNWSVRKLGAMRWRVWHLSGGDTGRAALRDAGQDLAGRADAVSGDDSTAVGDANPMESGASRGVTSDSVCESGESQGGFSTKWSNFLRLVHIWPPQACGKGKAGPGWGAIAANVITRKRPLLWHSLR